MSVHPKPAAHAPATAMLHEPQDPFFLKLQIPGLLREQRQFEQFMQVDLAHVVMLVEEKIIDARDGAAILRALVDLEKAGPAALPMDIELGSFLLQVEAYMGARLGEDIGGRTHTGRSRIDQGATVRRLFKRRQLLAVAQRLNELQAALVRKAADHLDTVMPGYTHMQHSQPWVFGHYLLSIVELLQADFERLSGAYARLNRNPLGAVGLAGTSWPLNRERTTRLLGFSGMVNSSRLGRDASYAAETIAVLSFIMSNLNDLATDLHIWSTQEFALVETADAFCGTSSIFPQKKNPEGLEAIRYAAGGAVNWLGTALAIFRGEGSGDQAMRELPMIDGAFDTAIDMLTLTATIVGSLTVHADRMRAALSDSWCASSNLADLLVSREALSFRQAHHAIAQFVRTAMDAGVPPGAVTAQMLQEASAASIGREVTLSTQDIRAALDPARFVATRQTAGSVSLSQTSRLLAMAETTLAGQRQWLGDRQQELHAAREELDAAVSGILASHGGDATQTVA